jgi:hypothetical protein
VQLEPRMASAETARINNSLRMVIQLLLFT